MIRVTAWFDMDADAAEEARALVAEMLKLANCDTAADACVDFGIAAVEVLP